MREEFVRLALKEGSNRRELMRRFGISPATGYKWLQRYAQCGLAGLDDQSRRPRSSPRRTAAQMETLVVKLRSEYPTWGGRKLARVLQNRGVSGVPAPSTITEILRRHRLLDQEVRQQRDYQRFEKARPNEMWQMDFKGDFLMRDRKRCYPLTVCDDHSRFNVVLQACPDMKATTVQRHLGKAFERYGLPETILCDNGSPWSSNWARGGHTKLVVWLMLQGVRIVHGRPYHPQTQGKQERFHKTLQVEVLDRCEGFTDLGSCQRVLLRWRQCYNWQRPHESLEMAVPGERYEYSLRRMPETPADPQQWYLPEDNLRRVQTHGIAEFRGKRLLVGEAFAGQLVALRPRTQDHWEMRFASSLIGIYDLNETPPGQVAIRPQPPETR